MISAKFNLWRKANELTSTVKLATLKGRSVSCAFAGLHNNISVSNLRYTFWCENGFNKKRYHMKKVHLHRVQSPWAVNRGGRQISEGLPLSTT